MDSKIVEELIKELKQKGFKGEILKSGDHEYDAAIKIDNGRIQLKPALVIRPKYVENKNEDEKYNDVKIGLNCAREKKLPFTVKGGGHSAAGYCLNQGGVVMDLKHLNKITYNGNETVTVEMGVIWYDVYKFMENQGDGLIPVGGGCPTVAPPGFMLGGGYSFVSRSYGMSIDNLISLKIVTPDGELQDISRNSKEPEKQDLFWACCGGGGGNFGIVVEMTMKVHKPNTTKMPVKQNSTKMLVGQIRYPLEMAEEVLAVYNQTLKNLPKFSYSPEINEHSNKMAIYGYVGQQFDPLDNSKKVKTIGLTPVYNGDYGEGIDILKDLLKLKPINTDLRHMTLPEWEYFNGNTTKVENRNAYIRSLVLPEEGMNNDVAKLIIKHMSKAPSSDSFAVWTHVGGAIAAKKPGDTAYYHRDAMFVPEVKSIWNRNTSEEEALANIKWAYEFFEEWKDKGKATGAYVNYIDPLLHDWANMYYGGNYEKLKKIKNQIDPDNHFSFQQSIGSSFNPPEQLSKDLDPLKRTMLPKQEKSAQVTH